MKRLAVLLFLLLLAQPALAQDLPLEVKGEGVKTIITVTKLPFTVTAPPGAGYYAWYVPQGVSVMRKLNSLEVIGAPNGYIIIGVDAVSGKADPKTGDVVFSVKNGGVILSIEVDSQPPPSPPPPPPVDPKGIVKHLTFAGPTPTTAGVVNDAALRTHLDANGIAVHVVLPGDPGTSTKKWVEAIAAAGGMPCVVIQSVDGAVLGQARLTTVDAVKELVKPYLGK